VQTRYDIDSKPQITLLNIIVGVLKTYRLQFEPVAPMHALFVRESAKNHWSISSKTLREFVEHFGPGTEQLDIYSGDGRVSLTSFTEKIVSGNGKILTKI
jgi:cell cycle checkpoint control protein RAD9A